MAVIRFLDDEGNALFELTEDGEVREIEHEAPGAKPKHKRKKTKGQGIKLSDISQDDLAAIRATLGISEEDE